MAVYYRRQRLHIVAAALNGLFQGGLVQYLAFAARSVGASVMAIAGITAFQGVASAIAFSYAHRFDHIPSNRRTAIPQAMAAILFIGLAFTRSAHGFVVLAACGMFLFMSARPFTGSLIGDLYPARRRGQFLGPVMVAATLAAMAANGIAGWLLDRNSESFRWVFPLFALIGVAAAGAIARIPLAPGAQRGPCERAPGDMFSPLHDRRFLLWSILYTATTLPFWIGVPAIPVFFRDELAVGYGHFGLAQLALNGGMLVSFLFAGRLIDRRGSVVMMSAAWLGVSAAYGILGISSSAGVGIAALGLYGLSLGINDLAWFPVALQFAPREQASRYMGIHTTFFGVRSIIGSLIGGVMMEYLPGGSRTAILLAAALVLPGAVAIWFLRGRMHTISSSGARPDASAE